MICEKCHKLINTEKYVIKDKLSYHVICAFRKFNLISNGGK